MALKPNETRILLKACEAILETSRRLPVGARVRHREAPLEGVVTEIADPPETGVDTPTAYRACVRGSVGVFVHYTHTNPDADLPRGSGWFAPGAWELTDGTPNKASVSRERAVELAAAGIELDRHQEAGTVPGAASLTPGVVAARVASIDTDDREAAHGDEDAIRKSVLEAIAAGAEDPVGLARAALATRDLAFERWYA